MGRRGVCTFDSICKQTNSYIYDSVYQMSMLEIQSAENATPQGVVLALAGPIAESSRDHETMRTLRMYNLASLISLAKWTISQQKVRSNPKNSPQPSLTTVHREPGQSSSIGLEIIHRLRLRNIDHMVVSPKASGPS